MRSDLVARVQDPGCCLRWRRDVTGCAPSVSGADFYTKVSGNTFVQSTGRWTSGVIVSALRRSIKSNHARMTPDFHRQGTAMYRLLFSQDERATPQQRRH